MKLEDSAHALHTEYWKFAGPETTILAGCRYCEEGKFRSWTQPPQVYILIPVIAFGTEPTFAMYVHSARSPFEARLNKYMSSGEGFDPFTVEKVGGVNWASSLTWSISLSLVLYNWRLWNFLLEGFTPYCSNRYSATAWNHKLLSAAGWAITKVLESESVSITTPLDRFKNDRFRHCSNSRGCRIVQNCNVQLRYLRFALTKRCHKLRWFKEGTGVLNQCIVSHSRGGTIIIQSVTLSLGLLKTIFPLWKLIKEIRSHCPKSKDSKPVRLGKFFSTWECCQWISE